MASASTQELKSPPASQYSLQPNIEGSPCAFANHPGIPDASTRRRRARLKFQIFLAQPRFWTILHSLYARARLNGNLELSRSGQRVPGRMAEGWLAQKSPIRRVAVNTLCGEFDQERVYGIEPTRKFL
jgi:hypothetical protein